MSNDKKYVREYAEWNNNWWEKAGDFTSRRALLIGDSITNGYRDSVKSEIKEDGILVDKLCGSRCAGDPILTAEIKLAVGELNGYTYQAVHFNNGLHGGCNDTLVDIETYKRGITEIASAIVSFQPSAKLIIATSTHMTKIGAPQDIVDKEYNAFALERNDFLRSFALENGFALDDLYYEAAGNPDCKQVDGVHFDGAGFAHLGHIVAGAIRTAMN